MKVISFFGALNGYDFPDKVLGTYLSPSAYLIYGNVDDLIYSIKLLSTYLTPQVFQNPLTKDQQNPINLMIIPKMEEGFIYLGTYRNGR